MDREEAIKAIADLTEAIRLNPADAGAYKIRGKAYFRIAEYEEAIDDFNKMIKPPRNRKPQLSPKLLQRRSNTTAACPEKMERQAAYSEGLDWRRVCGYSRYWRKKQWLFSIPRENMEYRMLIC
ncbi:hypothetical protein AGMMS49944_23850 [Spirochaetia bacterium]|nr:hypothetical protein AGMMS49944_23850 [Spirochaetia bacterium]